MTLPVSVFIIALNEADRIGRPIRSVANWADEVIVIDSGSDDGTPEAAAALGARVIHHPWQGYGLQKRFGEEQCRHHWVLNLDADEEVTPPLAREIQRLFSQGSPEHAGYWIGMRDVLPGQEKAGILAYTKWTVRLYDKNRARFSDSPVHDSVIVTPGSAGTLTSPCLHHSFRSVAHAIDKLNAYSTAQCKDLLDRGKSVSTLRLCTEFFVAFIKVYLLRRYVLHGKQGFIYAVIYAFGRFIRLAKWHEERALIGRRRDGDPGPKYRVRRAD